MKIKTCVASLKNEKGEVIADIFGKTPEETQRTAELFAKAQIALDLLNEAAEYLVKLGEHSSFFQNPIADERVHLLEKIDRLIGGPNGTF